MEGKAFLAAVSECLIAHFIVVDLHRIVSTYHPVRKSVQLFAHARLTRVSVIATRCRSSSVSPIRLRVLVLCRGRFSRCRLLLLVRRDVFLHRGCPDEACGLVDHRMSRRRWPWTSTSRGFLRVIAKRVWLCFVIPFRDLSAAQKLSTDSSFQCR